MEEKKNKEKKAQKPEAKLEKNIINSETNDGKDTKMPEATEKKEVKKVSAKPQKEEKTVLELLCYKEAAISLFNYYTQEGKILEGQTDERSVQQLYETVKKREEVNKKLMCILEDLWNKIKDYGN